MIASGDLAGAGSVIGVQYALMLRAGVPLPGRWTTARLRYRPGGCGLGVLATAEVGIRRV